MAQQLATRLNSKTADGQALRKQVGISVPSLDPETTSAPAMATPAPLGEAQVGLTDDDPRKQQTAMQRAGVAETVVGTKLG